MSEIRSNNVKISRSQTCRVVASSAVIVGFMMVITSLKNHHTYNLHIKAEIFLFLAAVLTTVRLSIAIFIRPKLPNQGRALILVVAVSLVYFYLGKIYHLPDGIGIALFTTSIPAVIYDQSQVVGERVHRKRIRRYPGTGSPAHYRISKQTGHRNQSEPPTV
jgi:heme A synthase